jgi:predicted helicase
LATLLVIDMKGNARTSGERRRQEGGNVFSDAIRVGVAVYFLVRKEGVVGSRIFYNAVDDYWTDDQKQAYLRNNKLQDLDFKHIIPDKNNNWIYQSENDWDAFLPVGTKETKLAKSESGEQAIFKLFSLGVVTSRDDWTYGYTREDVALKARFFIDIYNSERERLFPELVRGELTKEEITDTASQIIKWSRATKQNLLNNKPFRFTEENVVEALNRPFIKLNLYFDQQLNEMQYQIPLLFRRQNETNPVITFSVNGRTEFAAIATKYIPDYALYSADAAQCLPLYRYDKAGNRLENVTNWGLNQFRTHYKDESISRSDIFNYVYGVLHDPAYRKKYELNLRREFPRIPFYEDFAQWAAWGERLLKLHLDFEMVEPYPLQRVDLSNIKSPKAKLRVDKAAGEIVLDTETTLSGVPAAAWDYKLGNRSALEWVLERYKERTPKDKTVAEKFNTYRFADYKEDVITLLGRVCAVSVATVEITEEMVAETGARLSTS